MTKTYSFTVDIDIFQGVFHHVINGTEVLIINSSIINSYAKSPILILNIYRIIIGVTEQEQKIDLPGLVYVYVCVKEREAEVCCWTELRPMLLF